MASRRTTVGPKWWIVVHPETGDRLCNDLKWRSFAFFGTFKSSMKFYRYKGNAYKTARRFSVNGKSKIVGLFEGQSMDGYGNIFDEQNNIIKSVRSEP